MFFTDVSVEPLECRRLLTGVTILAHGYQGTITGWVASAADAIIERLGGQTPGYIMRVGDSAGDLGVLSFNRESGPDFSTTPLAEMVVKLDWTAVDDGSVSTAEVGTVVADYMMSSHTGLRAVGVAADSPDRPQPRRIARYRDRPAAGDAGSVGRSTDLARSTSRRWTQRLSQR